MKQSRKELYETQAIYLIKEIYKIHSCGGALHIVLDDGNTGDSNLDWCVKNSIPEEENPTLKLLCKLCVSFLLPFTERQRDKIIQRAFQEMREEDEAHKEIMNQLDKAITDLYKEK